MRRRVLVLAMMDVCWVRFGKYGVLSFNGNKMITTSGGGALICPDGEAKREIMFYATQARELIRITSMSGSGIITGCRIFVRVSGVVR